MDEKDRTIVTFGDDPEPEKVSQNSGIVCNAKSFLLQIIDDVCVVNQLSEAIAGGFFRQHLLCHLYAPADAKAEAGALRHFEFFQC